jgi:hypothetical protein
MESYRDKKKFSRNSSVRSRIRFGYSVNIELTLINSFGRITYIIRDPIAIVATEPGEF